MSFPSKYSLARELTFWVPTHASQSLVTHPRGVSTLLSYHARGSPLVMALSWVVSVPGSPSSGVDTSQVRIPPSGARPMALKPPFSSPYYCSVWSRLEASLAMSLLGNVSIERRLYRATPLSGDASYGRCLSWATPHLGDASPRR